MGSRLFFCRTERLQSFTLRVEQIPVLVKEDEGLGLLRQLSKNNKTNVLKLFYFPRHNRMKLFLKKHCNFNVPALIIIYFWNIHKVKKILKESLDLISSPSPTVKIQIIGGKVCFRCKGKTLLGIVNKLFVFKSLLTTSSNVLPLPLSRQ